MKRIRMPMHRYGEADFDKDYLRWGFHDAETQAKEADSVVRIAGGDKRLRILDLACGTGDITVSLAGKYPAAQIVGSDLSRSMARIAFRKTRGQDVALTIQDMAAMAIKDNSFSIVTGGYALRNAPEVDAVIRETARILKPGGKAAFLDFSKSPRPMVAAFQCAALVLWGSLWGAILHARPSVYAYLGHSLAAYPDRLRLHALFEESGLSVAASLMKMLGMIEIVIVQKK